MFALIISVQQSLAPLRNNHTRIPVLQSTSRQNHRVERLWPDINQRINEQVLVEMESNGEIDMSCEITKFSVSSVSIMVRSEPVARFISEWNSHQHIPNVLARNTNRVTRPNLLYFPLSHERDNQVEIGLLELHVLVDPLHDHESLCRLRDRDFCRRYPDMQLFFTELLHGSPYLLKSAILYHIQLSRNFSSLL